MLAHLTPRVLRSTTICALLVACGPSPDAATSTGQKNTVEKEPRLDLSAYRLAVGDAHACAWRRGEGAWCFGHNSAGELGVEPLESHFARLSAGSDDRVEDVDVGFRQTCACMSSGAVFCWGRGGARIGETYRIDVPPCRRVAVGRRFLCALTRTDDLYCRGALLEGLPSFHAPTGALVGRYPGVTDLAAGDRHLCLRTSDGHATCLGSNRFGELSGGAPYAAGTRQVPLTPISSIAVDRTQTCAVTETGEVFCWGDDLSTTWNPDRQGMRADPRAAPWANRLSAPMRMRGVPEATHVLAGFRRACVVGAEGDLWCWGRPYGVEFREPSVPQRAPTHIASDVVTADAHRDSGCMMNRAGEIACWGPIAMCPTCLSEYLVVPPGVVLASVTPTGSLTVRHGQYD